MKLVDGTINRYFNMKEFACKSDNSIIDNPEVRLFYDMLYEFRIWYNRSISPSSAYRTPEYNKLIGGAKYSQHLYGKAIDVHFPNEPMSATRKQEFLDNVKDKWYSICDKYGIAGGVGFYSWGFHIDSRTENRSFWDYR